MSQKKDIHIKKNKYITLPFTGKITGEIYYCVIYSNKTFKILNCEEYICLSFQKNEKIDSLAHGKCPSIDSTSLCSLSLQELQDLFWNYLNKQIPGNYRFLRELKKDRPLSWTYGNEEMFEDIFQAICNRFHLDDGTPGWFKVRFSSGVDAWPREEPSMHAFYGVDKKGEQLQEAHPAICLLKSIFQIFNPVGYIYTVSKNKYYDQGFGFCADAHTQIYENSKRVYDRKKLLNKKILHDFCLEYLNVKLS